MSVQNISSVNLDSTSHPQSHSKFCDFFEIITNKNQISGKCKLCEKKKKTIHIQMKNRNTSGLKKHLISAHRKEAQILFPIKQSSKNAIDKFFKGPTSELQVCTIMID